MLQNIQIIRRLVRVYFTTKLLPLSWKLCALPRWQDPSHQGCVCSAHWELPTHSLDGKCLRFPLPYPPLPSLADITSRSQTPSMFPLSCLLPSPFLNISGLKSFSLLMLRLIPPHPELLWLVPFLDTYPPGTDHRTYLLTVALPIWPRLLNLGKNWFSYLQDGGVI